MYLETPLTVEAWDYHQYIFGIRTVLILCHAKLIVMMCSAVKEHSVVDTGNSNCSVGSVVEDPTVLPRGRCHRGHSDHGS